jgi:hypothetical protein
VQGAADDQRHRDGVGVHHQDMLEAERKQLRRRQYLVDRVNRPARGQFGRGGLGLDRLAWDLFALDPFAPDQLAHGDIPALQVSRAPLGDHAIFRPVRNPKRGPEGSQPRLSAPTSAAAANASQAAIRMVPPAGAAKAKSR